MAAFGTDAAAVFVFETDVVVFVFETDVVVVVVSPTTKPSISVAVSGAITHLLMLLSHVHFP